MSLPTLSVLSIGARVSILARPELHAEVLAVTIRQNLAVLYLVGWWEANNYSEDTLQAFQVATLSPVAEPGLIIGFQAPEEPKFG